LNQFVGAFEASSLGSRSQTNGDRTVTPLGKKSELCKNIRHVPYIEIGPAPVRKTDLYDVLELRQLNDVRKLGVHLGKEAQSALLRWWNKKGQGRLVDVTLGQMKGTMDEDLAQAAWAKFKYFSAQTRGECEMSPTSLFRDVLRQAKLKGNAAATGGVAANFWSSNHVMGLALDEGTKCQNQPTTRVPFDIDDNGKVIFVNTNQADPWKHVNVVQDIETKAAILRIRRREFAEDAKSIAARGGDIRAWEEDQYNAALGELLFPDGMGVYGAHVMDFEAGLKAGLVGAYCSVEQQPSGKVGHRPDPMHSQESISGSRAECGAKLGGEPECYRVNSAGKPDCWRGSHVWNKQLEHQRRRYLGDAFDITYGVNRLNKYMKDASGRAVSR
jgi:hypothetical protein